MWNGYLGRTNIGKHRIELLRPKRVPVESALYRAGSKTRELEKVKINKMLSKNSIDPAQNEWAVFIVLVLYKYGTL